MSTAASILDPDAQRVIEEQRARRLRSLATRDRAALVVSVAAFLATAVSLAVFLSSHRSPSLLTVALLVGAYALAFRLDFEVGTGSAVPTQLILVPMLFVLPVGWVPLAVAAGIVLGSLIDHIRGSLHLERVFGRLVNSWHAVGPALVLGLAAEGRPTCRGGRCTPARLGRSSRSTTRARRRASRRLSAWRPGFTWARWPGCT